ncbi:hypothetical protein [Nesterenkonia sp. Act20]|uniref:hypothetical protein n=1 Tax=Nesterenkonia sp. Act20 TaxID=1483432 RepID=UPI001C458016|nr:hypothetical protein [Nesterenkonia sp. Act20]
MTEARYKVTIDDIYYEFESFEKLGGEVTREASLQGQNVHTRRTPTTYKLRNVTREGGDVVDPPKDREIRVRERSTIPMKL